MKRISFKISGISLTLPLMLFKELKVIFKEKIESMGYDELEKKFPLFFTFFLRSYEKKVKRKENVI